MEVGHGQKLGLTFYKPLPRRTPLTLRAMPIAAAVKRDDGAPAPLVLGSRATWPPLELIVWSIPILVILFLGGVISAYPPAPEL
jgi:hypothetical protein